MHERNMAGAGPGRSVPQQTLPRQSARANSPRLFAAQRFEEVVDLLANETIWPYQRWAVKALVALGRQADAIRFAESCRGLNTNDAAVDQVCEEILLASGFADEAYRRYALRPVEGGSYAAAFRAACKKYPHRTKREVLNDFVATTPGREGKWFAAANAAGLLALRGFAQGHGYDVTGAQVLAAFENTLHAAKVAGIAAEVRRKIDVVLLDDGAGAEFVRRVVRPIRVWRVS